MQPFRYSETLVLTQGKLAFITGLLPLLILVWFFREPLYFALAMVWFKVRELIFGSHTLLLYCHDKFEIRENGDVVELRKPIYRYGTPRQPTNREMALNPFRTLLTKFFGKDSDPKLPFRNLETIRGEASVGIEVRQWLMRPGVTIIVHEIPVADEADEPEPEQIIHQKKLLPDEDLIIGFATNFKLSLKRT